MRGLHQKCSLREVGGGREAGQYGWDVSFLTLQILIVCPGHDVCHATNH